MQYRGNTAGLGYTRVRAILICLWFHDFRYRDRVSRGVQVGSRPMTNQDPERAEALSREGIALHQLGRLQEARLLYEEALRLQPRHGKALHLLSLIALQTDQPEQAVALIDEALLANPESAVAHNHRGNALLTLKQYDAAISSYDKAIELKSDYAEAHYNRGNALLDLQRHESAVDSFDSAIACKRDYWEAHYNRGLALACLNRHSAAISSYDAAISLKQDFAAAHESRGLALFRLNEHEAAIASHDAAIAINPHDAHAHYHKGNALRALGRYEEAIASYGQTLALDPHYRFLHGLRLHTKMQICAWDEFAAEVAELSRRIERDQAASPPFPVQTLIDSAGVQKQAAQIWCREVYPANGKLPAMAKRPRQDKIRIGYFSADFRDHAVAMLMAGVFEAHERSRFELTAFSFGPDTQDGVRKRLEKAFDRFVDVRDHTDHEIAVLARRMQIDIAVDLGGYTEGCRTNIFALRAAPLQVSYIGYLGTMSTPYMDYLIADPILIPMDHRRHYSEKIIYLPSYQANDAGRRIADRGFTRAELGLPKTGFVFCCFNGNFKITPDTFESWMRILARVPDSVLFLYAGNAAAQGNLRKAARRSGIEADRIVFGGRLPSPEYLARYRAADLFLDTLPYNAGTTASDALWAGLPVLTRVGEAFAARIAASLLEAVGLPELITATQDEYETLAIDLAANPSRMAELKHRLARNRNAAPLFDTHRFTRTLESAFAQIYERCQADLPTDHICVNPVEPCVEASAGMKSG